MKYLGIDLSLRSTGLVCIGDIYHAELLKTNAATMNDELLIHYIGTHIVELVDKIQPDRIGLEELSLNSITSSKDIMAGNYWYLRTLLKLKFPQIPVDIFTVAEWRNPLFNKEERKLWTESKKALKLIKDDMKEKKLGRKERLVIATENEQLVLNADIKYLTFKKLPEDIQKEYSQYKISEGRWDLSDAYSIARYMEQKCNHSNPL